MLRFDRALWVVALALVLGCANGESFGRGDSGPRIDAPVVGLDAPVVGVDAPIVGTDAPVVVGVDAPILGVDAPIVGTDAPFVAADTPVAGTGVYLDRCTTGANCASGLCADDRGSTRFCTRSCTTDLQCAHEHICLGGVCLADDTGAPCSVGSPESCATGLCLGSGAGGACTRSCTNAGECPAGFGCTIAGGSTTRICVDIERRCTATGTECGTGLCDPSLGCTATCRSVADCPATFAGLEYTCTFNAGAGANVCVPSPLIAGSSPIGAVVSCPPTGVNTCRSGACDPDAIPAPACVQTCTAQGGCPPGSGCFPLAGGASIDLVCERAGGRDLSEPCTNARDCHSALCDGTRALCTRLCNDGICPTGWRCEPVAGFGIAICRP